MRIVSFLLSLFLILNLGEAQTEPQEVTQEELIKELTGDIIPSSEIAGEFFGVKVPLSNYYFAKKVVLTLNAPWRPTPKDKRELEDLTWQELLFSYEAFRRGIKAEPSEVEEEIEKILKADKVSFNWKKDKASYENWVEEKLNESAEVFENQIAHLIKLKKLREEVINSFNPSVTEEEAYQKFLDEYNTLSVELYQFDELEKAESFYKKVVKDRPTSLDLQRLILKDLILSYQAIEQNLKVEPSDIEKALFMILRDYGIKFNWRKEEEKLNSWLKENIGLSLEEFKKTLVYFIRADKLREKIANGEVEDILEKEEYKKLFTKDKYLDRVYKDFCSSHKSKDLPLFKNITEAERFYKKIKRSPGLWEEEKRKFPKRFKRPGFVALDFLINIWRFRREDAYNMLKRNPGEFYPPSSIYKGYAIFKILKKRLAKEEDFSKRKDYYLKRVKKIKQFEEYKKWVEELKKRAKLKVFVNTEYKPSW